jgi:hypothetical protein
VAGERQWSAVPSRPAASRSLWWSNCRCLWRRDAKSKKMDELSMCARTSSWSTHDGQGVFTMKNIEPSSKNSTSSAPHNNLLKSDRHLFSLLPPLATIHKFMGRERTEHREQRPTQGYQQRSTTPGKQSKGGNTLAVLGPPRAAVAGTGGSRSKARSTTVV